MFQKLDCFCCSGRGQEGSPEFSAMASTKMLTLLFFLVLAQVWAHARRLKIKANYRDLERCWCDDKWLITASYIDSNWIIVFTILHLSQVCQWLLPAFVSGPTMAGRDDSSRLVIKRCVTWDPQGGATTIFDGWLQVCVLMWFWNEGSRADVTIARNCAIDHVLNPERTPDSKGNPHSNRKCMIGRLLVFWIVLGRTAVHFIFPRWTNRDCTNNLMYK